MGLKVLKGVRKLRIRKIVIITLVTFMLATITAACTKQPEEQRNAATESKSQQEPARQTEIQKVVVAEAVRGEYWLPIYLAKQLDYFKDEGLDVNLVTYKDGPLALLGLVAGDAQFCVIGFEPVLRAYEQGKQTKVILTTANQQPYMFASRSGINSISDLKGKVIFAGMPSSAPYAFARAVLKLGGLDPDKDVKFANLEYGAEVAALQKGEIDASYVRATKEQEFLNVGANILVDATDPEQHMKVFGSERYEAYVVQVTDEYIKENPETVQKFANAVVKAIKWQQSHSDEEIAEKVAPLFPGRNIDGKLVNIMKRSLSQDGSFTEEGYKAVENFCKGVGIITKSIPMDDVIDQSFIKKANENLGN